MKLRDATVRPRPRAARAATACALAAFAALAAAQQGSRLADAPPPAASRWQAEIAVLDDSMRARLLVATDPRGNWLAAKLDNGDPDAQVRRFASARVARPDSKLFLATLAMACMAPLQPLPDECDAVDRLADWATRDVDNGVPMLLLANRSRQRNNATAMVAYLEEAARRPRFDDYWNQGALAIWEEVRALPGAADPAARAELAASYGAAYEPYAARAMDSLCRDAQTAADAVRAACVNAGMAAAQRGATWSLRTAGARLAERSAGAGPAQDKARQQLADVQRQSYDCAASGNAVAAALDAADPAARARAVTQWETRLAQDARDGEVAACAGGARKG